MLHSRDKSHPSTSLQLANLSLPVRVLFTGYLLSVGLGLLVAGGQILMTHGMADGKFGLSVDDIVYSYYGNRGGSRIEGKLLGSMKDKASAQDKAKIIKWIRNGASKQQWNSRIGQVFASNCIKCHGVIPGLPDFKQFTVVKTLAATDMGASPASLTRVSHIHLFGIGFIFFFVGGIFSLASGISEKMKALVISVPFIFLVSDVLSWWLTSISPQFAWLTIVSGIAYTLASVIMWSVSCYQMWWPAYRQKAQDVSR